MEKGNVSDEHVTVLEKMTKNEPIKIYTCGDIVAKIWEKERFSDQGEKTRYHKVNIRKEYHIRRGNSIYWNETNDYLPEDLPDLALVTEKAHEYIKLIQRNVIEKK